MNELFVPPNIPNYFERRSSGEIPCKQCGVNTHHRGTGIREWYMVHDRVWAEAHCDEEDTRGFLCILCLEARLGRKLTAVDFKSLPVNYVMKQSSILQTRVQDGMTPDMAAKAVEHINTEVQQLEKMAQEIWDLGQKVINAGNAYREAEEG